MKTTIIKEGNTIQVSSPPMSSMNDLREWSIGVMDSLLLIKGQKACLITISPILNSVGLELGNYQKVNRGKTGYLINWDINLSESFLRFIADCEEFNRGLLFFVLTDKIKDIFDTIDACGSNGYIDFSKVDAQIVVLENDGKILTWHNPTREIELTLLQSVQSSSLE